MCEPSKPGSSRIAISRTALSKHIRREVVRPDFESDAGLFFDPARLPELKQAIDENRQRNWRHIGAGAGLAHSAAIGTA